MDEFEEDPPFNVVSKVERQYKWRVKKAMSINALNLKCNQFAQLKSCKGATNVMENPLHHS